MSYGRRDLGLLAVTLAAAGTAVPLIRARAAPFSEYGESGEIPGVSFTGGDGSYKRAVQHGVTLGICPDFPWTYEDNKTKHPAGLDVAIFEEVTHRLGIKKIEYAMMPIASIIPALLSKRIDVDVDNLHENPERLKVVDFTSPAYYYGGVIAVQKGNPKHITSWEDLAGKTVGAYGGSFYDFALRKRTDLKKLEPYTTSAIELTDLAAGRIDAIVDDEPKVREYINQHPNANMQATDIVLPASLNFGYARYCVRKSDVDLNWAISRAIDEMRADGTIAKLLPTAYLTSRDMFNYTLS